MPEEKSATLSEALEAHDTASVVAIAGHPLHAMMVHFPIALAILTLGADLLYWWDGDPFWLRAGLWSAGVAFFTAIAAGLVGLVELLLVPGIRTRVSGWAHGVAGVMLTAVLGASWSLRLLRPEAVLPLGLPLALLGAVLAAFAGWHGGKLIFHHGIAIKASEPPPE